MRFGYFDDENREYVITTPKTPYPWINYLGTENFFGWSRTTAGGYCFYRDARLRRLTALPLQQRPDRRRAAATSTSTTAASTGTPTYHAGEDARSTRSSAVTASATRASPASARASSAEVLLLRAARATPPRSTGDAAATRSSAEEDAQAVLVRRVLPVERLRRHDQLPAQLQHRRGRGRRAARIYHKTEYRERRDHYAFYHVNAKRRRLRHRSRDRSSGLYNGLGEPHVVAAGRVAKNSVASGWQPIASHGLDVDARAGRGEDVRVHAGLRRESRATRSGRSRASSTRRRAQELIERVLDAGAGGAALQAS